MNGSEMLELYARGLAIVGLVLSIYTLLFDIRYLWPAMTFVWVGMGTHSMIWMIDMTAEETRHT